MPYAKIVGEDHRSYSDQSNQSNIRLAEYDAVFEENPVEEKFHYWGISTIAAIPYLTSFRVYMLLTKYFYHGHRDILEKSRQLDVAVENDIDLGPIGTYKKIGTIWKILIPLFAILGGLVIGIFTYSIVPSMESPNFINLRLMIAVGSFGIVFFGLNHGFTEIAGSFAREKHMADIIDQRSEEFTYENVLVICGDQHGPVIGHLLEESGWNTELTKSSSWLAKTFGSIRELRLLVVEILH